MSQLKCIGCYDLHRKEITAGEKPRLRLIVYTCPRLPYDCVIGGIMRPGQGTLKAVTDCPQRIDEHCILCSKPPVSTYGEPPMVYVCKDHDAAWGKWLNGNPERRAYFAPRHRGIKARWIEVFREFIEGMRVKAEGEC